MKQIFILGRNPILSRQEIISFLDERRVAYSEIFFEKNILGLETDFKFFIEDFGGSLKIGKIIFEGDEKEFDAYLNKNEIIESDKFTYAVFGNLEPDIFKQKFKINKKKAMIKNGREEIKFQDGTKEGLPKAEYYLFLHKHKNKIYFGKLNQSYDALKQEKRDMEKPVRREHLAIPPRLSKIMINLAGACENDLILDCFCGIGGILQEALLRRINVYGIDKDGEAIKDAFRNLNWLKKNYHINNYYIVEKKNALNTPNKQFDAIVTETPLGKVTKRNPNPEIAKRIILDFENLIIPILRHLRLVKKPKAKIAITFPRIKNIMVDYKKIEQETGLRIIVQPITEGREKQFIQRDIVVLR